MQIDEILNQLKGVKRAGSDRWMALCCAHEDKNRSLSIREVEGRVLLYCFSGCSYESLAAALGIDRRQFVPRPAPRKRLEERPSLPNPEALWKGWQRDTDIAHLDGFAMSLGVDTEALRATGCAWARNAWAFPMRDHNSSVIGIRLRGDDGNKWAIKGSHQGLFIPTEYPYCVDDGTLYIVEGPTDLAAAMTIGLYSIGRPSCLGQETMVADYVRTKKVKRVVIISDNDTPGLAGARKLQEYLPRRSCIWTTPVKDVREYVQRGGTVNMIENSICDLVWKAA